MIILINLLTLVYINFDNSVGRVSLLHGEGHRFESCSEYKIKISMSKSTKRNPVVSDYNRGSTKYYKRVASKKVPKPTKIEIYSGLILKEVIPLRANCTIFLMVYLLVPENRSAGWYSMGYCLNPTQLTRPLIKSSFSEKIR